MNRDGVTCPVCATAVASPPPARCPTCGADLAGERATRIRELDAALWRIGAERKALVDELRASTDWGRDEALRAGERPDTGVADEQWLPGGDRPAPAAPPPGQEWVAAAAARAGAPRASRRFRDVSAQTMLAAAGVALLAVAAIVFAAVTWQHLGALPRTAILVAVTAIAVAGARTLVARQLRITGEAVAVLAVLLGLVDVHGGRALGLAGLDRIETSLYIAVTSTVLAAASVALGRWTRTVAPTICAALLLLTPAPALFVYLVDILTWETSVIGGVVLLAGAAGLELLRRTRVTLSAAGMALRVGAIGHWLVASIAAAFAASSTTTATWLVGGLLVGAAATAFAWAYDRGLPTGIAAVVVATSIATVLLSSNITAMTVPFAAGAVALAAAIVAFGVPQERRVAIPLGGLPLLVITWFAVAELAGAFASEMSHVVAQAWAVAVLGSVGEPTALATLVLIVAAIAVALLAVGRRVEALVAGAGGAVLGTFAATVVYGTPAIVRVGVGLLAVGALAGVTATSRTPKGSGLAISGVIAWSLVWALTSEWLTVGLLAVVALGLGAWIFLVSERRLGRSDRSIILGLVVGATLALPGTTAGAAGSSVQVAGLITVITASVALVAASRTLRAEAGLVVLEVVISTATGVGLLLAANDPVLLAASFAIAGVAAAAHAIRPDRRGAIYPATLLLSASSWTLLGDADVRVVEAYTAVPALLTLLIGVWRLATDDEARSFTTLSAGLALALVPTAVQVLDDPSDLPRVLALAAAGSATLLAGAFGRLAAPTVYGAGAVGVVALTQLWVAASHLPRWVTFATLGLLLIFGSATYERQRARLVATRRRVDALR
jgi:hypothetical protein